MSSVDSCSLADPVFGHITWQATLQKGLLPWGHWSRKRATDPYFSRNQPFWGVHQTQKAERKPSIPSEYKFSLYSVKKLKTDRWLTRPTSWREGEVGHTVILVVRHCRVLFSILIRYQNETFESTLQTMVISKRWVAFRFRMDGKHLMMRFSWKSFPINTNPKWEVDWCVHWISVQGSVNGT